MEKIDTKSIVDVLPVEMRKAHGLIGRPEAIRNIHFPPEDASLSDYELARSDAHRRLIFEEFFWVSFAAAVETRRAAKGAEGHGYRDITNDKGETSQPIPLYADERSEPGDKNDIRGSTVGFADE